MFVSPLIAEAASEMIPEHYIVISFMWAAAFIFLGIFASKLSSFLQIPILLLILLVGMTIGEDGFHLLNIQEDKFGFHISKFVGTLALVYILFSGGYDTSWKTIKGVLVRGTVLSTLGVILTAGIVGTAVAWYMHWPLEFGFLLGSAISSTDAAAVFAILRSGGGGIKEELGSMIEYESGSNDPMAAFLTMFMIGMIASHGGQSYFSILPSFAIKMGMGICVGLGLGWVMVKLLNHIKLDYDGLYYVCGMGIVLLAYGLSEVFEGNGFMSVYVCGLYMGNSRFIYKHGLGRFCDGIAWLMQVAMFLVLGLLVTPSEIGPLVTTGILIALFLMFVARPISVFLCMIGSKFNLAERTLIAWGGIRGAAPIVLSLYPCVAFSQEAELSTEFEMARTVFNIVFFVVFLSVFIQGKTLVPLARLLGLDENAKEKERAPLEFEETGNSNERTYEIEIPLQSPIVGMEIKSLGLPTGVLVYLIRRKGAFVVPNGATKIQPEDGLMVMTTPDMYKKVLKSLYLRDV